MAKQFYENFLYPALYVLEGQAVYRSYSVMRIICDASCRVEERRQNIPRHKARGKSTCGYLFLDERDSIIKQSSKYLGEFTVDQAEYKSLILALDNAAGFCRREIEVWMDSSVIVGQLNGFFCLRSPLIKPLFDEVKKLEMRFASVKYFHHNRGSFWARAADKLANEEYSKRQSG